MSMSGPPTLPPGVALGVSIPVYERPSDNELERMETLASTFRRAEVIPGEGDLAPHSVVFDYDQIIIKDTQVKEAQRAVLNVMDGDDVAQDDWWVRVVPPGPIERIARVYDRMMDR